mgnify:CR=1 FL=1
MSETQPVKSIGHFRLIRLLGEGGLGQVFLAYDTQLHRKVALKVVHPSLVQDEESQQRFLFEASTTAQFNHPNIVTIYSVGTAGEQLYLALEHLKGETLRERMREGHLSAKELIRIGHGVMDALVEAHSRGILHLDLKPENVFLTHTGRVCVLDFGLARLHSQEGVFTDDEREELSSLLQMQNQLHLPNKGVQGTPGYVSPELWGQKESTEAADIWAWGIMMLEVYRGVHPYQDIKDNLLTLAIVALKKEAVPGLDEIKGLPSAFVEILRRCLSHSPEERPSAEEVKKCLDTLLFPSKEVENEEKHPFRGLMSFTERHAEFFFGRSAEIAYFTDSLKNVPVLPVVGASGAGKSSFLHAGILPHLREEGDWKILLVRPGHKPFVTLASRCLAFEASGEAHSGYAISSSIRSLKSPSVFERELLQIKNKESTSLQEKSVLSRQEQGELSAPLDLWGETVMDESLEDIRSEPEGNSLVDLSLRFREHPESLGHFLRTLAEEHQCKIFFVVDQLEELFTMVSDEEEQHAFLQAICLAADDPLDPVRVSFTLRHDFLQRLHGSAEVRDALRHMLMLWSPTKEALEEVITQPVKRVGYTFDEPELVREMIQAVDGEPMGLPLLQFALQMLWVRRDQNHRMLRRQSYEEMGGIGGALAQHADGIFTRLSEAESGVGRELLLRLVTSQNTRRILPQSQVLDGLPGEARSVLQLLVDARLLSVRKGAQAHQGERTLELAHESLIHNWGQLRRWIEESHEDLAFLREVEESALLWQRRGSQVEETWQGSALHEALRHLQRCTVPVPPIVEQFLKGGLEREQRASRIRRRVRWVGASVLSLITLVSLVAAWVFSAQSQRDKRQRAQIQVEGARSALQSGQLFEARARLRSSFEAQDSALGRFLWWRLRHQPIFWQTRFGAIPYRVVFSPDGTMLAVACQDKMIHLFNLKNRKHRALRGHTDQVLTVDFSPDGKKLLSTSWNGEVRIWELAKRRSRKILQLKSFIFALGRHLKKPWIVAGDRTGTLRLWSWDKLSKPLILPNAHKGGIMSVKFHPSLPQFYTTGSDKRLKTWRVTEKGIEPVKMPLLKSFRGRIDISPDGKILAFIKSFTEIQLVDAATFKTLRILRGPMHRILQVAFDPRGKWMAMISWDKKLFLWDYRKGKIIRKLKLKGGAMFLAVHPKGDFLATVSIVNRLRVWDTRLEPLELTPGVQKRTQQGVTFSPDGRHLVAVGNHRTLLFRDKRKSHKAFVLRGHTSTTWKSLFLPKRNALLSASADGTLRLWDLKRRKLLETLKGHQGEVHTLLLEKDGRHVLSGSYDGDVRRWNLETKQSIKLFRTKPRIRIQQLALSRDQRFLAVCGGNNNVQLWDYQSKQLLRTLKAHTKMVFSMAWGKDGRILFTGGHDKVIRMWNISDTFHALYRLKPYEHRIFGRHKGRIYNMSLHPSGRYLVASSSNGMARIWDIQKGNSISLRGHHGEVNDALFSPDGKMVATGGDDGTIRTWWSHNGLPYWRAPLFLPKAKETFTHNGWRKLSKKRDDYTPTPKKWRKAIAKRARSAHADEANQKLCVYTHDAHVELWDMKGDKQLFRVLRKGVQELLSVGNGCVLRALPEHCTLAGGSSKKGGCSLSTPEHFVVGRYQSNGTWKLIQKGSSLLKRTKDGFVVVANGQLSAFSDNGSQERTLDVGPGVSAVSLWSKGGILGFRTGSVELLSSAERASSIRFEGLPASPVVQLVKGPMNTVIIGFANGLVGLWSLHSGRRYYSENLHGAVQHISFQDGMLYAVSELGEISIRDLRVFGAKYCELMREIWSQIPVVWQAGLITAQSIPGRHACQLPE